MKAEWECVYENGKVVRLCKSCYSGTTDKHKMDQVNRCKVDVECDKCQARVNQISSQ